MGWHFSSCVYEHASAKPISGNWHLINTQRIQWRIRVTIRSSMMEILLPVFLSKTAWFTSRQKIPPIEQSHNLRYCKKPLSVLSKKQYLCSHFSFCPNAHGIMFALLHIAFNASQRVRKEIKLKLRRKKKLQGDEICFHASQVFVE